MAITKIAFGGGCHWCTEAVFQSLKGVTDVAQGFVASEGKNNSFSEAVIVEFNETIDLKTLIEVHLLTHKSTSNHTMRTKYRSAIYYFNAIQKENSVTYLTELQPQFESKIITKVLPFKAFKPSEAMFQNYYQSNPNKPFCNTYIAPKLKMLMKKFSKFVDATKIATSY